MTETEIVEPLLVDLIDWIAREEPTYRDVMDAWRTSCPRLPVWEEANTRGLVTRIRGSDGEAIIRVTESGRAFLQAAH